MCQKVIKKTKSSTKWKKIKIFLNFTIPISTHLPNSEALYWVIGLIADPFILQSISQQDWFCIWRRHGRRIQTRTISFSFPFASSTTPSFIYIIPGTLQNSPFRWPRWNWWQNFGLQRLKQIEKIIKNEERKRKKNC